MIAERSRHEDDVPRSGSCASDFPADRDDPDAAGVDEQTVGLPTFGDLGVAGDDGDAGFLRRGLHRFGDPLQRFQGQALLQDETRGQPLRPGADHRQIVDGAAHCQASDVPTRKEEGRDDVRVGRDGEPPRSGVLDDCRIITPQQGRVLEGRIEDAADERLGHPASAPMADHHNLSVVNRYGAHCSLHGHGLSSHPRPFRFTLTHA